MIHIEISIPELAIIIFILSLPSLILWGAKLYVKLKLALYNRDNNE